MKTTITVEEETAKNLNLIKYAMGLDTLDKVIIKLLLNYKINQKQKK